MVGQEDASMMTDSAQAGQAVVQYGLTLERFRVTARFVLMEEVEGLEAMAAAVVA